ncbi:SLC13 family permease [Brevibacillus sp. NRS-1366]|uniref:SLC13 family permease n=1 Tax=Brevibacillus sp. NRS-1366 TaxID=3233899 RepID=UPI003D1F07F4
MSIEIGAIIVLLLMFVVGAILPINIGIFGFVAAFIMGVAISGLSVNDIFSAFPADLFILLAGVTFLFAIVQKNGTIDLISRWGLLMVRGNTGFIPWVIFVLGFILTSIGTSAIAAASILIPIALRIAYEYRINPLMMGLMLLVGVTSGAFSPLNLFGVIVNGMMNSQHIPHAPGLLFLNTFILCVIVAVILFIVFGGLRHFAGKHSVQQQIAATAEAIEIQPDNNEYTEKKREGLTWYKGFTLLGIAILIILALGYKVNMGFAAFGVGLALSLLAPKRQEGVMQSIPWSIILMVTGIVTYVGVLEKIGVIKYMTHLIEGMNNPVMAALTASYVGGLISSFASTTGFLAAIIPLSIPILKDPTVSSIGVISSISFAASIVDISPFSTNGAMLLANAQGTNQNQFFRKLLIVSGCFVVLGPGLGWLLFVIIGTPW